MSRMLVTGGAGFIGSNFVHYWLRTHDDARLVVLDALTYAGNLANLHAAASKEQFRFVRGDICDHAAVLELIVEEGIDTIVHFAAESHVDRSIVAPDAFVRTNVVGTHALLEAARKAWLERKIVSSHRFHHISTDEVYGSLGASDPAFSETTAYAPNSPYSASKAASDHLVRAYHHTYGLQTTTSNCSNNYGPYHFPEKLIPLIIVNILQGRTLPLYGDGGNIRDWLHVEDHCRGIDLILARGENGHVYNIGGHAETTNLTIVRTLCRIADEAFAHDASLSQRFTACPAAAGAKCESLIQFVKDRPGHDRRYAIDCAKIEQQLGFAPSVSLDSGLRKTFEWYTANQPWWHAVMDGSYRNWVERQYGAA